MNVSIIIPAYNAEKTIAERITSIQQELKHIEIIIICNGCIDNTSIIAGKFGGIKVANYPDKLGKGGAIIEGLKHSSNDVIGFIDADMSFSAKDLKFMLSKIPAYDCVIASKWNGASFGQVKESGMRKIYGRCWNFLVNSFFDLNISDTQAGMKVFKKSFLPANFVTRGFEFDVELLAQVKKKGGKIYEHKVDIKETRSSTVKKTDILRMLIGILKIALWRQRV
ncbi:MAG: glycosyltransferase family 2 protein [Candidatus Aenigmarchaeota archaeon]|nr:glycosyltransferase family 2 protein [Candidatus Aenigmarchaeota archaeon]